MVYAGPTWVGATTPVANAGASSIDFSTLTGLAAGDSLFAISMTANETIAIGDSGWEEITSISPQSLGTPGAAGGVRLTVYRQKTPATGSETTVAFTDSGDINYVVGFALRGSGGNLVEIDSYAFGAATTGVIMPGPTTTVGDCLVTCLLATDRDSAGPTYSAETNANLVNLTERFDAGTGANSGGGLYIVTGEKATAGAVGNTSATRAAASGWVSAVVAFKNGAGGGASQDLFPSLVTRTKTIYAPTVSQPQLIAPSLVTRSKSLYAPTVTVGSVTLAPSLVTRSKSLFAPVVSASYTLAAPLLTRSRSIYAPVVTTSNVLQPGLLTRAKSLYGPTITVGSVTLLPGLLTRSRTIYAPSVTQGAVTIAPPLLSRTKVIYAPSVSRGSVTLLPGLVTRSKTIYAPVVSISTAQKDLYPPLLSRAGTGQDNKRMWRPFMDSFAA